MKLVAKKNSELELLIKRYIEKAEADIQQAKSAIEKFTGAVPVSFGYIWWGGYTRIIQYNEVGFPVDSEPKFYKRKPMTPSVDGKALFVINNHFKAAREFGSVFKSFNFGLDGNLLNKFGIPVMNNKTRSYCNWYPEHKGDQYYVLVPGGLIDDMHIDKSNQFTVESDD